MANEVEHCPRCNYGLFPVVGEDEQSEHHSCAMCDYGESRVKEGFEVKGPGQPITKVEPESKSKGGAS